MVFEIKGKVALVTGGASGIGLEYVKELLRNGVKGITVADIRVDLGKNALDEIVKEFGPQRAIFVKTDVTDYDEFENAFKETVEVFGNIDIVINNAGILNDFKWETEIAINLKGVINGMLLGMEKYLPKYQQGPDALIVNISSVAGVIGVGHMPVYVATKYGVIGATRSWGNSKFYNHNKVRVVAVCPGATVTPLITELDGKTLGPIYESFESEIRTWAVQKPIDIAKDVMNVIRRAPNGTVWIIEGGESAYEYKFPERSTMKNNLLPV